MEIGIEKQIDREIDLYSKEFNIGNFKKEYKKEMSKRIRKKKKEFKKKKAYLLIKSISFNNIRFYFDKYKKYKSLKIFIIDIDKEERLTYLENKYRKYINNTFDKKVDKINFLKKHGDYLQGELEGIKGKDTNLTLTYWLGVTTSVGVSVLMDYLNSNSLSMLLLIILIIVTIKQVYTSTRSDDFKEKSLIVIKRLIDDLEDELKEKDIILNIENRVIKIDDKITGLNATINNRKGFLKKIFTKMF